MSLTHRPTIGLVASSALLSLVPQAFAQSEPLMLEEVIVTAQKREQSLQDVPVAVQALSGNMLSNAGIEEFQDLVKISSSLGLQDNLSPFQKSVYIRGVGTTINCRDRRIKRIDCVGRCCTGAPGQFFY